MTTAKYYNEMKSAYHALRMCMLYGKLTLMKKYENGYYGHYIVNNEGMIISITEKEYELLYKAYYQEK